jgi:hypothetical protein
MIAAVGRGLIDWIGDGADRVPQGFAIPDWRYLARHGGRVPKPQKSESRQSSDQNFGVSFHLGIEGVEINLQQTSLGNLT